MPPAPPARSAPATPRAFPALPPPAGAVVWTTLPTKDGSGINGQKSRPAIVLGTHDFGPTWRADKRPSRYGVQVAELSSKATTVTGRGEESRQGPGELVIVDSNHKREMGLAPERPTVARASSQHFVYWVPKRFPEPPSDKREHSKTAQAGDFILGLMPAKLQSAINERINEFSRLTKQPLKVLPQQDGARTAAGFRVWRRLALGKEDAPLAQGSQRPPAMQIAQAR